MKTLFAFSDNHNIALSRQAEGLLTEKLLLIGQNKGRMFYLFGAQELLSTRTGGSTLPMIVPVNSLRHLCPPNAACSPNLHLLHKAGIHGDWMILKLEVKSSTLA